MAISAHDQQGCALAGEQIGQSLLGFAGQQLRLHCEPGCAQLLGCSSKLLLRLRSVCAYHGDERR